MSVAAIAGFWQSVRAKNKIFFGFNEFFNNLFVRYLVQIVNVLISFIPEPSKVFYARWSFHVSSSCFKFRKVGGSWRPFLIKDGETRKFPHLSWFTKNVPWIGSGGTGPDRFTRVTSGFHLMVQGPLMAGHLQGPINFTTQLDHLLSLVKPILNQAIGRIEVFTKAFEIIFSFQFLRIWFHQQQIRSLQPLPNIG